MELSDNWSSSPPKLARLRDMSAFADEEARRRRADERRRTWQVGPLTDEAPRPPQDIYDRFCQLEELRQLGWALSGRPYPIGPTPRHERMKWHMEKIG